MTNGNFKWLDNDIDSSMILKIVYKNNGEIQNFGVFNVLDVLNVVGDELRIKTGNIYDLDSLLNSGIVRFVNLADCSDIIDIPLRKMYMLYQNSGSLDENKESSLVSFKDLDVFSIIDEEMRDDMFIYSMLIKPFSSELERILKIASEYGNYNMSEKISALNEITLINHKRIVNDKKDRGSR